MPLNICPGAAVLVAPSFAFGLQSLPALILFGTGLQILNVNLASCIATFCICHVATSQDRGKLCLKKTLPWLSPSFALAVCPFSLEGEVTVDEEASAPHAAAPVNMASPLPSWPDLTGEPSQCTCYASSIRTHMHVKITMHTWMCHLTAC